MEDDIIKTKNELLANKENESNYVTAEMVSEALEKYLEEHQFEIEARVKAAVEEELARAEKETEKRIAELKEAKLKVIEIESNLPFYFYNTRSD